MRRRLPFAGRWVARSVLPSMILLLITGCGALGQTDDRSPVERAQTGDYASAVRGLEPLVEAGNASAEAVNSLYDAWARQGLYDRAVESFEELSESQPESSPIRLAAARANRAVGNYDEALAHLEAIFASGNVTPAVRFERASLFGELGRREESQIGYQALIDGFEDGSIDGDDFMYVALALWELQYFHDANDVFRLTVQQNPRNTAAQLAWGALFAETYEFSESVVSYEEVLAIDPNLPEAHMGIARVLKNENPERSSAALDKALEVNPNLIDAHLLRAEQRIDAEQYDEADEEIEKALEVNPNSAPALSLLATTHFLRGEEAEFEDYVRQVLEQNPLYGDMYYTLADRCVSVRLYAQAVEFAREAFRLDPTHWEANTLLGINLLRIGREDEGKSVLESTYENFAFNPGTINTLRLLDSFENFDRLSTEHFDMKLHKEESGALAPYVGDLLEEAYDTLSAKYGFRPEAPITFEMFPDHEDFAVRTLGLPGLGALGVAFGRVVVMDSPSARSPETFNWGSTLWHEFAHVITLEMTDHKIPRWFSEGLSVYEERKAVPGWGDDLKFDYLMAVKDDQLLPISELNNGFVRPDSPGRVTLSYYQASIVCDYIESRWGFQAILDMLGFYREGLSTPEVFEQALGLDLEEFDLGFLEWVDLRVDPIDPDAFRQLVQQGHEAFEADDIDTAIDLLTQAVELYPEYTDEGNAYETLADAYLERGDTTRAIETLDQFVEYSEVAYSTYVKLARLKKDAGDSQGAADVLERAVFIHPKDLDGHRELGQLLLEDGRFSEAAREYEALLALGAPDLANTYFNLASAQYGAGQTGEARRSVLRSLEIAPSFEAAQELLLRIVR